MGGKRFVLDVTTDDLQVHLPEGCRPAPGRKHAHLDNDFQNELLMCVGLGQFILPKPNRLVVIRGGTYHTIQVRRGSGGG